MQPKLEACKLEVNDIKFNGFRIVTNNSSIPIIPNRDYPLFHNTVNISDTSKLYLSVNNYYVNIPAIPYATDKSVGIINIPVTLYPKATDKLSKLMLKDQALLLTKLKGKTILLPKLKMSQGFDGYTYVTDEHGKQYNLLQRGTYRYTLALNFIESNAILLNEFKPIPDIHQDFVKDSLTKLVHKGKIKDGVFYAESGLVYYGE